MKEKIKYKLLFFIRYFGDSFFYPFFSLYLESIKLGESKIGLIVSFTPMISILMNPIYSNICTNPKKTRDVLKVISIVEAIMVFLVGISTSYPLLIILTIIMCIFGSCHYGLMSSIGNVYVDATGSNFGSIRMFGSIAYIFGTIFGGYICNNIGYSVSFGVCSVFFILGGILYAMLVPIEIVENHDAKAKSNYFKLLKDKQFVLYAIFFMLLYGSIYTTDHFFGVYMRSRGMSDSEYGMIYALIVSTEVIAFLFLNKKGRKINLNIALLISCGTVFLRLVVNYLYLPMIITVIVATVRGISWAIFLDAGYKYITNMVGKENSISGIMLCELFFSVYLFIADNVNGKIIEMYDYKAFYAVTGIISLVLTIYAIIRLIVLKDNVRLNKEKEM